LFSSNPQQCVQFYRAIGVPLEEERHGEDEHVHHACDIADVHIAVFPATGDTAAPVLGEPGCSFVGFAVDSVDSTVEAARSVGAEILQPPDEFPWGRRAVLRDPDGRPVEIFARPG